MSTGMLHVGVRREHSVFDRETSALHIEQRTTTAAPLVVVPYRTATVAPALNDEIFPAVVDAVYGMKNSPRR